MKGLLEFVQTTLVGEFPFLLPLVLTLVLLHPAVLAISKVRHPIAPNLPVAPVAGVRVAMIERTRGEAAVLPDERR